MNYLYPYESLFKRKKNKEISSLSRSLDRMQYIVQNGVK